MEAEYVLRQFGLTDTESKVYLTLLNLGESTVTAIVKKVKIYSANVYGALRSLESKGLISCIKKENKQFYSAMDPKALAEIWESRKQNLDEVLPNLQKIYNSKKSDREVSVLGGIAGMKTYINDLFEIGKPLCSIGSSFQVFPTMQHRLPQFSKRFEKRANKFPARIIAVDRPEVRKQALEFVKLFPSASVRFYPESAFSPVAFNTYGDRLVQIIWEEEPVIIMIKDKCIAKAFRNYFEMLWAISKD